MKTNDPVAPKRPVLVDYLPLLEGIWLDENNNQVVTFQSKQIRVSVNDIKDSYVNTVRATTAINDQSTAFTLIGTVMMNNNLSADFSLFLIVDDTDHKSMNLSYETQGALVSFSGPLKKLIE